MNIMRKSFIVLVLGGCLLMTMNAKASSSNEADLVEATVVVPEEEVMAVVTAAATNGKVSGNGVRLRAKASSTATVLELMYNNETVLVDIGNSVTKSGVLWYFLKRTATGTWGYSASQNIIYNG